MTVGLRVWTTGFAVQQGDGPTVHGKRLANRGGPRGDWQLTWEGGSALVAGNYEAARQRAEVAARLLTEVAPLRAELDRKLAELGREVKGDTGDDEGEF